MGALMKWLNSLPGESEAPVTPQSSVGELRQRCLAAIADCTRLNDERIRQQIGRAANAQHLWQLRSDVYQAISRQHCEAEAARRLNELLPAFEGWLPPGALRRL
jgi:hypothetical protein